MKQQFRKMWLADCISIVLVVCIYGFMAIWSFCRNMQHLLRGNFDSFVKSERDSAAVVIFGVRCGCQHLVLNNNQAQISQGGPAPDCLTTALSKPILNPAYNWFVSEIRLLMIFRSGALRLRS